MLSRESLTLMYQRARLVLECCKSETVTWALTCKMYTHMFLLVFLDEMAINTPRFQRSWIIIGMSRETTHWTVVSSLFLVGSPS
jgi:hypothetical protein